MGPVKFPLGPVKSTVHLSMEDHSQKLVSSTAKQYIIFSLATLQLIVITNVNVFFSTNFGILRRH